MTDQMKLTMNFKYTHSQTVGFLASALLDFGERTSSYKGTLWKKGTTRFSAPLLLLGEKAADIFI